LFDDRTYFLQSSVSATWFASARTSFTFGGGAFLQNLKSTGLSNGWGYNIDGSMRRRVSKGATLGLTYEYSHFEFPGFFSKSDSHTFHGLYATALGQFWTLSIEAGGTVTEGQDLVSIALDPALAAIFGQATITGLANYRSIYPSGTVVLKRQFRHASLGFNYFRGVNSGNGAYNTGRLDNVVASVSYTGIRKWNLGAEGCYYTLKALGQSLGSFTQYSGGAGVSYALGRAMHLSLRYDFRDQQINISNYKHSGSRATVGLNFSPGSLPLALW
jgi:hypothetical protein